MVGERGGRGLMLRPATRCRTPLATAGGSTLPVLTDVRHLAPRTPHPRSPRARRSSTLVEAASVVEFVKLSQNVWRDPDSVWRTLYTK